MKHTALSLVAVVFTSLTLAACAAPHSSNSASNPGAAADSSAAEIPSLGTQAPAPQTALPAVPPGELTDTSTELFLDVPAHHSRARSLAEAETDAAPAAETVAAVDVDAAPAVEADAAPTYAAERFVLVNFPLLKSMIKKSLQPSSLPLRIKVKPFANETLAVVIDQVDQNSASNVVMSGYIEGDTDSAVTLVMNGDVIVAAFRMPTAGKVFEVQPVADGVHVIHKLAGSVAGR